MLLSEVNVHHQLRGERVNNESEVVRLLHVEVAVSVGYRRIVHATLNVGVKIGDAGARDAHVVGQSDVLRGCEVVGQAGRGHEVAVVCMEVGAVAEHILHALPGVLVAHTGLRAELPERSRILGIAGEDVVEVFIVH